MSRVRSLAPPQRVVLVVGIGLCFLSGWVWWHLGGQTTAASWFSYSPNAPPTEGTDTVSVVTGRRWEDLAIPVGLVVSWTAVSFWLLGPPTDGDRRPE